MSKNSGHEKAPVLAGAEALDNVNRSRKNVEMDNSTAVTPDNLPVVSHAGGRVVTTALLAKLYGTDDNNLIQNYQRNSGRFVAGKHFHKLEGAELKAFKDYMTEGQVVQVAKNTRQIILWTERGAARHAKMLDTDEAWEVFEKLEDSYFQIKGQSGQTFPMPMQTLVGTVIGSDGEHVLDQVIDQKASALPSALRRGFKHTMKSRLRTRFSVQKTALIPAEELANACNFVAAYVFEGEFLPKRDQIQLVGGPQKRYLVSFDHKGEQRVEEVADDACVLSTRDLIKGMVMSPGDIPVSTPDMFEFLMAAVVNLRGRFEYMARRAVK
ncbi:ORF6N domain-containing protein [Pseudomonas sp. Marseille-Q5299]|uniref:ORF6N domain-containing protein n=1 Tax=Pseudomonas sp. Marseille-Q5299 TaxID=2942201 RepID=UPI00207457DA|nr:ORF6N domain-containing protein [Pseudomonas sp. Marseille-Q5299]